MTKTVTTAVCDAVLAALVLGGCSSDSAPAPSDQAFCADAKAAFGDYQPGFDAIFDEHPEPTLEQWAAFLPSPTKAFDEVRTRVEAVDVSPGLADEFAAATDAMDTVSANYHRSIDTARAGDQAAFTAVEDKNQNTDLPAMGKAFDSLKAACGAAN